MEFTSDSKGNKYFSFEEDDDSYQYEINKIGNKLDDFEILQILSEKNDSNDMSFVAKVRSLNNNKIYSLKKLYLQFKDNQDFKTKQQIYNFLDKLKSINHPHIIKYYNYFEENNGIYVIMEYMDNSDILEYIQGYQILNKQIPETEIWNILLQCLSALNYLNCLNYGNLGIKMTNIFINNMYNIKIGVFRDFYFNRQNYSQNEEIKLLMKFIYTMVNSQYFTVEDLDKKTFIDNLVLQSFENNIYSSELRNIINKIILKQENNISFFYEDIKKEYSKKFTKNTSINAVIKCLYQYKVLYDRISAKREIIVNNKEKYFMNYWYLMAIDALNGTNENNLQLFYKEFRMALANAYSKLDGNKEIDPIIVLIFILDKMHKELNEVDKNFIQEGEYNKYINSLNDMKNNYTLNGEELDRTNKNQMLVEFAKFFKATMNSPISDLFVGFIKTKSNCQKCRSGYYSFSNYLYCVFDLSELASENNFDLIEDGFRKNKNTAKEIDENSPDKIWCERCQTYENFKEFNRLYNITNQLIIVFYRGKNYDNRSKIIFKEEINLKEFIEPDIKSPTNYNLVGSVNRKIENDLEEYVPYSQGFNDIQKFNNEQIIMLFYNSKDYTELENN